MARYIKELPLQEDPNTSFAAIHQYLTQEGFTYEEYKGENVFRKGTGWVSCPTFIKVSYSATTARLEAWIKYAVLPGVYVGEYGMDGFAGALAKGTMRRCSAWVAQRLGGGQQPVAPAVPQQQASGYESTQQNYGYQNAQQGYGYQAQQGNPYAAQYDPNLPKPIPEGQYVSIGDYRCHYASEKFRKSIRTCAIILYVLCAIGLVNLLVVGLYALLDTAIQLGLTLGIHLKKSKGCAIALIIYGAFSMLIGLVTVGALTGWGWLAVGIGATSTIHNVDKEYKEIMMRRGPDAY